VSTRGLIEAITEPDVGKHLLRDEGEVVVDEVRRHWAAFVRPAIEAWLGLILAVLGAFVVDMEYGSLLLVPAVVLFARAAWITIRERRECFVITNMRVFRLHGVLNYHLATMPLARILDISVTKPLVGRIFGYGHFVFESAAQTQGLKEIRYVARADARDLTIQRVVQRSGLRGGPKVN
jgi:uncharacterized membrane protein YdbT with pleckstrin-like domain